jgi:hypothetical protein
MKNISPPASLFKIWNRTLHRYDDPCEYAVKCDGCALSYDWTTDVSTSRRWGPVLDDYVIQLFSGLFDINGDPIYDGDLLIDMSEYQHDMYFIYEVGLYDGSYHKPYIYKTFLNFDDVQVVGRVNSEAAIQFNKLKLIGSIYSTPLNVQR